MIKGLDISHHNGRIDFAEAKAAGYAFAFCKATQGDKYCDPTFQMNMQKGHEAGLLMGAYHFFDPRKPALDQALHYLEQLKTVPRPILPCGDFEWMGGDPEPWGQFDAQARSEMVQLFLDTVLESLRCKPFVYTSIAFANDFLQGVAFGFYPMWIARYNPAELPAGWINNVKIHQFTEKGAVPGVPSAGDDENRSPLTLSELTALAAVKV